MERGFSAKIKQGNRKNSRKCGSSEKRKQRNRNKGKTILILKRVGKEAYTKVSGRSFS